jgi:hypothetical protein
VVIATAGPKIESHGAVIIAETSKAPPKCNTVGVENALIVSAVGFRRKLLTSAIATNWSPIRDAPADPMIT